MRRRASFFIFLILLAAIISGNIFCSDSPKEQSSPWLNHHDTVSYVGMETCRGCHNDIFKTYIQTGMGQSFGLAEQKKSVAEFGKHPPVYDKYSDFYYLPYWDNGKLTFLEYRLDGKDTVHKRIETIDYIIGSGQHTNSHLLEINGYLYQAPLTWYAQRKKWDMPPGFENGRNTRFSRLIGQECMSCHNAVADYVPGSDNRFDRVPLGIDCERCHGPGELHVKRKREGELIDIRKETDFSIVNPAKLSWERQMDVCQRCHLQGNTVLQDSKGFYDFRPGMKLSSVLSTFVPEYSGNTKEFIMASHAERLQMSPCFIQSNIHGKAAGNTITCISCHNPHLSVKLTETETFNIACRNCHDNKAVQFCTEDLQVRLKVNDNCNGCHMPRSGTTDIPHVAVTDHFIRVTERDMATKALATEGRDTGTDRATEFEKIKTYLGLVSVNDPDPSRITKAKAYISYVEKFEGPISSLDSAEHYLNSTKTSGEGLIQARIYLLYFKGDYGGIAEAAGQIELKRLKDPWTAYRVGQAYYHLQKFNEAEDWMGMATELAPDNLAFANQYAALLIEQRKPDQGLRILEDVLQKNPKYVPAWVNSGFAYLNMGQIPEARRRYAEALNLDPDDRQALLNMAALYNYLRDKEKVKKILEHYKERYPGEQVPVF